MKAAFVFALAAPLALGSCSSEHASAPVDEWVTAPSLPSSAVPYTPKPIITAHEQIAGDWVWQAQNSPAKAMTFDQMLSEISAVKSLLPEPLVLFSFAHHADRSKWTETRSRIADALGCSSVRPCIEGTAEQLR